MAASYKPAVYKSSGGDHLEVASSGTINIAAGGELTVAGAALVSTGGGIALASLTSGDVTFPGLVTVSSGLAVTGASTFAAGVKVSSGLLVSAGSSFSTGIKVSGASTFAEAVAFSTGIGVTGPSTFSTSVTISGGLTVSSGLLVSVGSSFSTGINVGGPSTFAAAVSFSSGIAVTGNSTFSAAITVSSGVNALKGIFTSAVNGTTGKFTGDLSALGFVSGITVGTSSGGALTLASLMTVKSTAGDPVVYTVEPQAGYICYIRCAASCATTGAAIVTTTGTWDGTNPNLLFSTGVTNPQFVGFIGLSTSRWQVLTTAYTTEVSFTNT